MKELWMKKLEKTDIIDNIILRILERYVGYVYANTEEYSPQMSIKKDDIIKVVKEKEEEIINYIIKRLIKLFNAEVY